MHTCPGITSKRKLPLLFIKTPAIAGLGCFRTVLPYVHNTISQWFVIHVPGFTEVDKLLSKILICDSGLLLTLSGFKQDGSLYGVTRINSLRSTSDIALPSGEFQLAATACIYPVSSGIDGQFPASDIYCPR